MEARRPNLRPANGIAAAGPTQPGAGATRVTLTDQEWRRTVLELMDRSTVIILLAGPGTSLSGELESLGLCPVVELTRCGVLAVHSLSKRYMHDDRSRDPDGHASNSLALRALLIGVTAGGATLARDLDDSLTDGSCSHCASRVSTARNALRSAGPTVAALWMRSMSRAS